MQPEDNPLNDPNTLMDHTDQSGPPPGTSDLMYRPFDPVFPRLGQVHTQPVYGCPPPPTNPPMRSVYPDVPPLDLPGPVQRARRNFDAALDNFAPLHTEMSRQLSQGPADGATRDRYMKAKDRVFNAAVELWLHNQHGRSRETPGPR